MFIRGWTDLLAHVEADGRTETEARTNANDVADADSQAVDPIVMTTVMTMPLMTKRDVVIVNAGDVIKNQTNQANRQAENPTTDDLVDRQADRQMPPGEPSGGNPGGISSGPPGGNPGGPLSGPPDRAPSGNPGPPNGSPGGPPNGPPGGPPGGPGAMGPDRAGESDATCTDRRRAKLDQNDAKLPKLPTSSSGLEMFQFGVFTVVTIASGRYTKRAAWIKCIIYAGSLDELSHIARKCRGLDYKLHYAAMDICRNDRALYELSRRLGEETGNPSQEWRIYSFFSLPGSIMLGLDVTYICLDLSAIKLVGGNEGLEKFWDTWSHCVKRIMDNPPRTT
jgi:hypothetical protein